MTREQLTNYGIALLRISLGVMFIAHSVILKFWVYSLEGTALWFASIGLPYVLGYVVFWVEALGGTALVLGFRTRWVAAAMVPVLLGATWAHIGNGWVFSNEGGGWEYPLYLTVLAAAQVLLGEGAFALDSAKPASLPRSRTVRGLRATA